MTRTQTAVRLAQGKWCRAWDVAQLFHVEPQKLMDILEYEYHESNYKTLSEPYSFDNMRFRIKQVPWTCGACDYDYNDCMRIGICILEENYGKEKKD